MSISWGRAVQIVMPWGDYSPSEAAAILNVSVRRVRRAMTKKQISGALSDADLTVLRDALASSRQGGPRLRWFQTAGNSTR